MSGETTNFDIYSILHALGALGYDKNKTPLYLNDKVSWTDKHGEARTGTLFRCISECVHMPRWDKKSPAKVRNRYAVLRDIKKKKNGYTEWNTMVVVFSKLASLERIIDQQRY